MSRTFKSCSHHSINSYFSFLLYSIVIFLTFLIDNSAALKCFECQVAPSTHRIPNKTITRLCSKFDESEDYAVDCPFSTMCVKRISKLQLGSGELYPTVMRGCADQKYTDQVFKQGAWRAESRVEEPYEEGCETLDHNDLTYCYCRGNLCNSATKQDSNGLHTDAMAVIFVFNILKYLNSGVAQY